MRAFTYADGQLHCEGVSLDKLARQHGTPLYVYSEAAIRWRYEVFARAFSVRDVPHTICYSAKANPNLSVLRLLQSLGAGFDVVSGGELQRVLKAAGKKASSKTVFSGVGKRTDEMDLALKSGILLFNVESAGEMRVLAERARAMKKVAPIAIRVNPDVNPETHPYISTGLREHKFGVPIEEALDLYAEAAKNKYLDPVGVSVHIGSQITTIGPFRAAMMRVGSLVQALKARRHKIRYVDAGGGLGVNYHVGITGAEDDFPYIISEYAEALAPICKDLKAHLLLEPGRSLVAPAGALVTTVLYQKKNGEKNFVVVDAAMNDLMRPSLYHAHHEVASIAKPNGETQAADVVGPICESGDFFARDRQVPIVDDGALLALLDTGAYGMSLASNYNSRPLAAEVMVKGRTAHLVRRRQRVEELFEAELS